MSKKNNVNPENLENIENTETTEENKNNGGNPKAEKGGWFKRHLKDIGITIGTALFGAALGYGISKAVENKSSNEMTYSSTEPSAEDTAIGLLQYALDNPPKDSDDDDSDDEDDDDSDDE